MKASKENPHIWRYFRELRNRYISDLRLAEEEYHRKQCNIVNDGQFKSKEWWKMVHYFMSGNSNSLIPSIWFNDRVLSDSKSKADIFNEVFLKQCHVGASTFTLPCEIPPQKNVMENIVLDEESINDILKSLNVDKARGPDHDIIPMLLKQAAPSIASSLTKPMNFSLR